MMFTVRHAGLATAVAIALAGCSASATAPSRTGRTGLPSHARLLAAIGKHAGCRVSGGLPDPACTPGAVFTNVPRAELCSRGYTAHVRDVPYTTKRAVYRAYGIRHHYPGDFEIDHLAPLEAEGANTDGSGYPPTADPTANLWPQLTRGPYNSHLKDELENWAHAQTCRRGANPIALDREIARDWITLYRDVGAHTLAKYQY